MERIAMKEMTFNEMEKIEGGISWVGFSCGIGVVLCCCAQEYALVGTVVACAAAMG